VPDAPQVEVETFAEYERFIHQNDNWPTAMPSGPVQLRPIDDMSPEDAVAAYNKVLRWWRVESAKDRLDTKATMTEPTLRDSPLMRQLVAQALAITWQNLLENADDDGLADDVLIESFMESSERMQAASAVTHYRAARAMVAALRLSNLKVTRA
jgi:hypothetical protein